MTEKQLQRTRSEIETLRLCHHPNIMQLYDVYENATYLYLVLEHLSGGTLFSYFEDNKFKLPEARVAQLVSQVAAALDYMHKYGIVHRDIKCDNIVLASSVPDAPIKVVDFGLATILGPNELVNDPVGTLCYAAPEIISGCQYGQTVDLWSVGILSHLLLVGYVPFSHPSNERKIAKSALTLIL